MPLSLGRHDVADRSSNTAGDRNVRSVSQTNAELASFKIKNVATTLLGKMLQGEVSNPSRILNTELKAAFPKHYAAAKAPKPTARGAAR